MVDLVKQLFRQSSNNSDSRELTVEINQTNKKHIKLSNAVADISLQIPAFSMILFFL